MNEGVLPPFGISYLFGNLNGCKDQSPPSGGRGGAISRNLQTINTAVPSSVPSSQLSSHSQWCYCNRPPGGRSAQGCFFFFSRPLFFTRSLQLFVFLLRVHTCIYAGINCSAYEHVYLFIWRYSVYKQFIFNNQNTKMMYRRHIYSRDLSAMTLQFLSDRGTRLCLYVA